MDHFVSRSSRVYTAVSKAPSCDIDTRPVKRLKVTPSLSRPASPALEDNSAGEIEADGHADTRTTDEKNDCFQKDHSALAWPDSLATALLQPETEPDVIEAYEAPASSQVPDDDASAPKWAPGKSSIYVDAFNLALDTVLADEAHLFDQNELALFRQWRLLSYQEQYLYVRLFLRKSSAWHRVHRLGYYGDMSDPQTAVDGLQARRPLPEVSEAEPSMEPLDIEGQTPQQLTDEFTFADSSRDKLTDLIEAVALLSLEELKSLAKELRAQGRNKAELVRSVCRVGQQQSGLLAFGVRRSTSQSASGDDSPGHQARDDHDDRSRPASLTRADSNRARHILARAAAITGPCIRLTPLVSRLFERVHLVFYRSTEWTEKSLTTIVLAKFAKRCFADYIVCRTSSMFASRQRLLEYETALKLEAQVDELLEGGGRVGKSPSKSEFETVVDLSDRIIARWTRLVAEEQGKSATADGIGGEEYLRRFGPAHPYTRVVHKGAYALGRLRRHEREYDLLGQLLGQRLFHVARRGAWYQRRALLQEHYMHLHEATADGSSNPDVRRQRWLRQALQTCEQALQDPDCHLTYQHDLQKRLLRLERRLRVPRRLQHDFALVRLREPVQHTVEGIQLRRSRPDGGGSSGGKTVWLDTDGSECGVEEMCLGWYRGQGWKGYHAEGGIVRTLFAYVMFDVLFLPVPNVFQTAYQTAPLDLPTDGFYGARASEINHRLAAIANGGGEALVRRVDARERPRRPAVAGLNWDFAGDDVAELARCFGGPALAAVCKVLAEEYRPRAGGVPDLVLWRAHPADQCMFAEVKSANDRLSDAQRLWIHVLTGAGMQVALCNAVAREVRDV